jgi:hypothetical protein
VVEVLRRYPSGPKYWKHGHPCEEELLRARLLSSARELSASRAREAELLSENEKLARELARVAGGMDAAVDKLDEVAQRLERCSCSVGMAISAELNGIGRT